MCPLAVCRFGYVLYDGVSFAKESLHITAENESFGDAAEEGDGCGEAEDVAHLGLAGGESAEVMVVLHGVEGSAEHGVLEVGGAVEGGDARGEALAEEEVSGAPGDGVTEGEETGGGAFERDGLLSEVGVAGEMDFDGTGEVEDAVDGRGDDGYFVKSDHVLV
jgi:hypothetical protein